MSIKSSKKTIDGLSTVREDTPAKEEEVDVHTEDDEDDIEEEEEEEDDEEDDEDDEDDEDEDRGMNTNSSMFGMMLDSVLSRHLEYNQDDNTLSLAEILLLIKQSIDTQNSIMSELLRLKMAKYSGAQPSSSSSGHHRSSSSSSSSSAAAGRQETTEERALRKQKEAARRANN